MSHLSQDSMTPERLLRYYKMVVRVCGSQANVPLLLRVWSDKYNERLNKRKRKGLQKDNVATWFVRSMLHTYEEYGLDYTRAARSLKIMYKKTCRRFGNKTVKVTTAPEQPKPPVNPIVDGA